MKKIKIGLPQALTYHENNVLWKTFFNHLGCKVIVSPETYEDILKLGNINTNQEFCLPYKIYLGHVLYLSKFCDYVLIANICNYGKHNKVCPRLSGTYDYIKTLIPKKNIIEYNIDYINKNYEFFEFIKMGLKITNNIVKILYSYMIGKIKQRRFNQNKEYEENNKFNQPKLKILLFSQIYNTNDKFIIGYIINYLKEQDIIPIFSNYLNNNTAFDFSEYFMDNLYWYYSKKMIGALYYYNHQLDGVIYLSMTNCIIDSLVNNLAISNNKHLPTLNLQIDEKITIIQKQELNSFIKKIKGEQNEK